MTSDQLTTILTSRPFQPFRIHLADGRHLDVEHPEFIAYRGGRTAVVYTGAERNEVIDLLLVTSLETLAGTSKSRRKQ